jgi:post-segregation antitoxin (ccd killing protein)
VKSHPGEANEKWLEENKAAIQRYNSRVRKRGVFSDGL